MKIALVRGPQLSRYEMQAYAPLADDHEVVAFGARDGQFEDDVDLPVRRLPCFDPSRAPLPGLGKKALGALLSELGYNKRLIGLEDELADFDIVHGIDLTPGYTYQCLKAKEAHAGLKTVLTVWQNIPFHEPGLEGWRFGNQALRNKALEETDLFLAMSETARDALLLEGVEPERVRVEQPGVDTERFRPRTPDEQAVADLGIDLDRPTIVFAGRLVWCKGVETLLDAFAMVASSRFDVGTDHDPQLVVVGEGDERSRLEERSRDLGIEQDVVFTGRVPYDRMPDVHSMADVFVLPSIPIRGWREQFGFVLAEAMASGTAIVATESGAIPEVVGDTADLVPPFEARRLAERIATLVDDEGFREERGKAARERAEHRFSVDEVARRFDSAYRSLDPDPAKLRSDDETTL